MTVPIAHRGLHQADSAGSSGVPENSLTAFQLATRHRLAVEMDVQQVKDGTLVVFHDPTLEAKTLNGQGRTELLTQGQLRNIRLPGTGEPLPTLEDSLKRIGGRTPILLDIKPTRYLRLDANARLVQLLNTYRGPIVAQSFDPRVVQRLRQLAPTVPVGQLWPSQRETRKTHPHLVPLVQAFEWLLKLLYKKNLLETDFFAAPTHKLAEGRAIAQLCHKPLLMWTVRGGGSRGDDDKRAVPDVRVSTMIFEGLPPGKAHQMKSLLPYLSLMG